MLKPSRGRQRMPTAADVVELNTKHQLVYKARTGLFSFPGPAKGHSGPHGPGSEDRMADEATEPKSAETEEKTEAKAEETPQGEPDWKALARKWEKRAKANAKELEDVKASQTDDAQARTADELAKAREEIKQLKASQERERTARTIARASGVDPEILIRMHGDTEAEIKENAELLAKSSKAKWPNVPDDGDSRGSKRMTREQILAIKDQGKRVEEIARNLDLFR